MIFLNQTDQELKRLGWTSKQGQKYLLETYGKHSRKLLEDDELLEFLQYLQNLDISVNETINNNDEKIEEIVIKEDIELSENLDLKLESSSSETSTPIDTHYIMNIIAKINVEMKRIGWNKEEEGRQYILSTYGKRSIQLLSDPELIDFLKHLEKLSNSTDS